MPNPIEAFISSLSSKEKKVLYIASGVVLLALVDRLVIGPVLKESHMTEEKIANDIMNAKKNTLFLQYEGKIKAEDKDYEIYYTKEGYTEEELIATFLSEVEDFAKSAKIALTNINPVISEERMGYTQFSLTIECTGLMKSIVDFIYNIDSSKKPIKVSYYNILPKDRNTYEVKCTITIIKAIIIPGQNSAVKISESKKETPREAPKDASNSSGKDGAAVPNAESK